MSPDRHYRPDIDGLRAIAVVAIIFYHARVPGFGSGFVGVDIFFVISGYLIFRLLFDEHQQAGSVRWTSFFIRRVRRLAPSALLVFFSVMLLGYFLLLPFGQQQSLFQSVIAAALWNSNILFWGGVLETGAVDYFGEAGDLQPLIHTWSLGVEEQFYLCAPILFGTCLFAARTLGRPASLVLLAGCALAGVASLSLASWASVHHPAAAFYFMPTRGFEFAVGMLLAWQQVFRPPKLEPRLGYAIAWAGIILLAASLTLLKRGPLFPAPTALLPALATAALILAGTPPRIGMVSRLLGSPVPVAIGRVSYSWYLWHWPLLVLYRSYYLQDTNLPAEMAIVVLALLLAALSYRFVEQPFRRRSPPLLVPDRPLVAGFAGATAILLTAAAALGLHAKQARQAPEFATLIMATNDRPGISIDCRFEKTSADDSRPADPCSFGLQSPAPPIVLWGDSHAHALEPGFAMAAAERRRGGRLFASSGCGPFVDAAMDIITTDHCRTVRVLAVQTAHDLSLMGPVGVVLVARWDAYTLRPPLPAADRATFLRRLDGRDWRERLAELPDALARTLAALDRPGIRVLLLSPIPVHRLSIPECLYRFTEPACRTARADVDDYHRDVRTILASAANRFPNVRVADATDLLCDAEWCYAKKGGITLYKDDDHLSATAARRLIPLLKRDLDWLFETAVPVAAQETGNLRRSPSFHENDDTLTPPPAVRTRLD